MTFRDMLMKAAGRAKEDGPQQLAESLGASREEMNDELTQLAVPVMQLLPVVGPAAITAGLGAAMQVGFVLAQMMQEEGWLPISDEEAGRIRRQIDGLPE